MNKNKIMTQENDLIHSFGNTHVSSSQPEKDFVQWLTEDALPTTKDILAELRALNAKRDEAKQWLKDNNFEVTEDAIQQRVNGCC
jgi:hypothetical protein